MIAILRRTSAKIFTFLRGVFGGIRKVHPRVALALVIALFSVPKLASAGFTAMIIMVVARTLQSIVGFFGELLVGMVNVLVNVAQYNDFVTAHAVSIGWILVRDITNMFFVLVLLLVAFGTILGHDTWNYKNKTLNKLLIAAIVVNFSKTIVGLLIDFSNVVMLTFVIGFKEAAGGNFANAFRINKMLEAGQVDENKDPSEAEEAFKVVSAYLLALFMLIVSAAVIIYMTIALVVRIVYLWLLTVMSPLAFFLRAVPNQKKHFDTWWGMLMEQLTFGPIMAFFLWLSLASVAAEPNLGVSGGATTDKSALDAASASFATSELQSFIIAVALLIGGTQMAEKMAGNTGKLASRIMGGSPVDRAKQFTAGAARMFGGAVSTGVSAIPLAVGKQIRDKAGNVIGRERVQLGALTGVVAGTVAKKAKGALGLDPAAKESKLELERIKALEATGKGAEAQLVRQNRYQKAMKKLDTDGMTGPALIAAYNDAKKKDPNAEKTRMLALKMAQEGGFNGKSAEIAAIAGADETLKKMMLGAAKKSGDAFADIDMSKPEEAAEKLAGNYAQLGRGEKAKFARAAADGAYLGADGKLKNDAAAQALKTISEQDFKEFPNELKKKVIESLTLAVKNGAMDAGEATAKRTELEAHGKVDGVRSAEDLDRAQQKALAKDRGLKLGVGAVDAAFAGINADTASFGTAENRKAFNDYVLSDAKNAQLAATAIAPALMTAGGGRNDLALGVMGNLTSEGVIAMARDPKASRNAVFGVLQAASGIASMSDTDINAMASEISAGMGVELQTVREDIAAAVTNAKEIVSAQKEKNSTLAAATNNITFKMDAARFVKQTAADLLKGVVIPGAAGVAGGAIGGSAAAAAAGAAGYYATKKWGGKIGIPKAVKRFDRGTGRGAANA